MSGEWHRMVYRSTDILGPQMGKDVEVAKIGDTILSNDTVRGSINMISANTKYPEKCLQVLRSCKYRYDS